MSAVIEINRSEFTKNEVLYGVSWEEYETILTNYENQSVPRFTYNSGVLEVYMPNSKHENTKHILEKLVIYISDLLEINYVGVGSTTFRQKSSRKGVEPDSGFYFKTQDLIEDIDSIDLAKDPPPELIIEIDVTSSSVPRFPIFADFGIKEIWRFDGEMVHFYKLEEGIYLEIEKSLALPLLTIEKVNEFVLLRKEINSQEFLKKVREFVAESKIK